MWQGGARSRNENGRLKKLWAEHLPDNAVLKDLLGQNRVRLRQRPAMASLAAAWSGRPASPASPNRASQLKPACRLAPKRRQSSARVTPDCPANVTKSIRKDSISIARQALRNLPITTGRKCHPCPRTGVAHVADSDGHP